MIEQVSEESDMTKDITEDLILTVKHVIPCSNGYFLRPSVELLGQQNGYFLAPEIRGFWREFLENRKSHYTLRNTGK